MLETHGAGNAQQHLEQGRRQWKAKNFVRFGVKDMNTAANAAFGQTRARV